MISMDERLRNSNSVYVNYVFKEKKMTYSSGGATVLIV